MLCEGSKVGDCGVGFGDELCGGLFDDFFRFGAGRTFGARGTRGTCGTFVASWTSWTFFTYLTCWTLLFAQLLDKRFCRPQIILTLLMKSINTDNLLLKILLFSEQNSIFLNVFLTILSRRGSRGGSGRIGCGS